MKKINSDFFHTWNEQSAYVFGFFLADGCLTISSSENGIDFYKLSFTQKDTEILEKIKVAMNSDHKITKRNRKNDNGISYYLQITNKTITSKLREFGFTTNKTTKIVHIPDIPVHLLHHMVRGFFDGDGSICNKGLQLDFSELTTIHTQFLKIFEKMNLPTPKIYYKKLFDGRTVQIIRFKWYKYSDKKEIFDWMYKDATIYLNRKKEIGLNWKFIKPIRAVNINEIYGKLKTIELVKSNNGYNHWKCECECGNIKYVRGKQLLSGYVKSCGCLKTKKVNYVK